MKETFKENIFLIADNYGVSRGDLWITYLIYKYENSESVLLTPFMKCPANEEGLTLTDILYKENCITWKGEQLIAVEVEEPKDLYAKLRSLIDEKRINGRTSREFNLYRGATIIANSASVRRCLSQLVDAGFSIELIADVVCSYYENMKYSKTITKFLEKDEFNSFYDEGKELYSSNWSNTRV